MNFAQKQQFTDLELVCADGSLWYSKFIFAGMSQTLAGFGSFCENKEGRFEVKYMSRDAMSIILQMYCLQISDNVEVNNEQLIQIAQFAHIWQVKKLAEFVAKKITASECDIGVAFDILMTYEDMFDVLPIHNKLLERMEAMKDVELQKVSYRIMNALFADDSLQLIYRWAKGNTDDIHKMEIWHNPEELPITTTHRFRVDDGDYGHEIIVFRMLDKTLIKIIDLSLSLEFKKDIIYRITREYVYMK